jgi:hypothetical protein
VIRDAVVRCSCCGTELPDTDQIDVRLGLPDVAFGLEETARHRVNPGLLRMDGHGCFARCLLPVRLSGELLLVLGTWMEISEADLQRAHTLWDQPGYADLVLTGQLANAIKPWDEELLGAPLTARVRNADEIPYVEASDHPLLGHVLHTVWDRHQVLRCFGHPLPVPVQTPLNAWWSIERTAGMAGRVVDGTSQFSDACRAVYADLYTIPPSQTPAEALAALTDGAPQVDTDHQLTQESGGGLRHAFWLTAAAEDGQPRHELYGLTIQDGQAVRIGCFYQDPDDLPWAQHVWRSITHNKTAPAS